MDDTIKKLENMNDEETDAFIKVGKNKMDNNIINGLIKQDEKAYLEAAKILVVNYIVLRMQKGIGQIIEINSAGMYTAKDIWDAMPDEYKDQSIPISFKDQEYIVTKEFYNHLKEVVDYESQNSVH